MSITRRLFLLLAVPALLAGASPARATSVLDYQIGSGTLVLNSYAQADDWAEPYEPGFDSDGIYVLWVPVSGSGGGPLSSSALAEEGDASATVEVSATIVPVADAPGVDPFDLVPDKAVATIDIAYSASVPTTEDPELGTIPAGWARVSAGVQLDLELTIAGTVEVRLLNWSPEDVVLGDGEIRFNYYNYDTGLSHAASFDPAGLLYFSGAFDAGESQFSLFFENTPDQDPMFTVEITFSVPEPATLALLGLGAVATLVRSRRS